MRDWQAFVREHFRGRRSPSAQAIEELAQHVEETYDAERRAGRDEAAALAAARAELERPPRRLPANMAAPPDAGFRGGLAAVGRDLRYARRMLAARPGFTLIAVLTLALGIGANTAIFSVVRSLLLEPLPFRDPDRLVMLWEADAANPARTTILSAPNYLDFQKNIGAFEGTGIFEYLNYNFSGDGAAERVPGLRVSASAFGVLGVAPELGRTFTPDEDAPGHQVAIISHRLWQSRFGGRGDIIGHRARINGVPHEIVGVMPARFIFPVPETGVWTPIAFNDEDRGRNSHSFFAIARLKAGLTVTSANAELDAFARRLARQYPDSNGGNTAVVTPMADLGVAQLRTTLLAVAGAVAIVLLIACVNVANLLLAQLSARRQEFSLRAALGASRRRLAAQLLSEAVLLSALGGIAGIGVAWATTRLLEGALPPSIASAPFRDAVAAIRLDPAMLGFTAGIAVLTGILFGMAPILGLRHGGADLRSGTRGATGRMSLLRTMLVGTEVALALVVLVAAGLMVKSLIRVFANDPGLDPSNVLVVTMSLPQPDFYGPPVRKDFCAQLSERVGSLPGIRSVGAISHLPLSGASAGRSLSIEGRTLPASEKASASYRLTCPGYFAALGIPIKAGRDFDARETTEGAPAVIVNEETAKRYWPGEDPIGRRIKLGGVDSPNPWMTVVGVVGNVRHFGLDDSAHREIFRPYAQAAWPLMTITAKTATEPAAFAAAVRGALQTIDLDLPVGRVTTMEKVQLNSTGSRRFPMMLLGAFGFVAFALSVIGVYGVVSFVVTQRTREIGIRVALGARRGQVIRLVIAGAMRPVVAGLVVGSVGAFFASRLLGSLLYNVKPGDPLVMAGFAVLLGLSAVAASLVPGARATRVDPLTVLKAE